MKKWIHHFVHVTTIISFLDITSYGRVDFAEDTRGLLGQFNMFRSIAKSSLVQANVYSPLVKRRGRLQREAQKKAAVISSPRI